VFLQGTRDSLADIKLIKKVTDGLSDATLVKFEGADHSFKAGKNVVIPQLVESVSTWSIAFTLAEMRGTGPIRPVLRGRFPGLADCYVPLR
jgi:hypothetical protein